MRLTEFKTLCTPNAEFSLDHLIEFAMRFLRNEINFDVGVEGARAEHSKKAFGWTCDKVIEYGVFDDRVDWTQEEIKWLMMACESGIEMMEHLMVLFEPDPKPRFVPMPTHANRFGRYGSNRTEARPNYLNNWYEFLGKKELLDANGVLGTHASLQLCMLLFKQTLLQGETDWDAWTKPVWVNNFLMQMAKSAPENVPF